MEKHFTFVKNEILNNKNLSLAEKGLLCILLSNNKDWVINQIEIAQRSNSSLFEVKKTFKSLLAKGFLTREIITAKGGRAKMNGKVVKWALSDTISRDTISRDTISRDTISSNTNVRISTTNNTKKQNNTNQNQNNTKKSESVSELVLATENFSDSDLLAAFGEEKEIAVAAPTIFWPEPQNANKAITGTFTPAMNKDTSVPKKNEWVFAKDEKLTIPKLAVWVKKQGVIKDIEKKAKKIYDLLEKLGHHKGGISAIRFWDSFLKDFMKKQRVGLQSNSQLKKSASASVASTGPENYLSYRDVCEIGLVY